VRKFFEGEFGQSEYPGECGRRDQLVERWVVNACGIFAPQNLFPDGKTKVRDHLGCDFNRRFRLKFTAD